MALWLVSTLRSAPPYFSHNIRIYMHPFGLAYTLWQSILYASVLGLKEHVLPQTTFISIDFQKEMTSETQKEMLNLVSLPIVLGIHFWHAFLATLPTLIIDWKFA